MKPMKIKLSNEAKIGIGLGIGALAVFLIARGVKASANNVTLSVTNTPSDTEMKWTVLLYDNGNNQIPLSNPDADGTPMKAFNEKLQFAVPADATLPLKMVLVVQETAYEVSYIRQSLGADYAPSWGPYEPGFVLSKVGSFTINFETGAIS